MNESAGLGAAQEERLARYRAGEMDDRERAAFEREALADAALAEALYREQVLDAVTPAAPARRAVIHRFPVMRVLLPVAAGLAILAAVVLQRDAHRAAAPGGDALRGGGAPMQALEPSGTVPAPPERFRWTRDPGAASYRLDLFDAAGRRVGTAVTADTLLAMTALRRAPLASGQWRVVALGADGLERPARVRATFATAPASR